MPTITLIQLRHHLADLLGDLGPHLVPSDYHEHKLPNNHRYNFGLILEMFDTLYGCKYIFTIYVSSLYL